MKWEEQIALDYLTACGHKEIVFEPDGNVPPDFSVGRSVAVEVRRLNENRSGKGLEQDGVPLHQALKSVLAEFDQPEEVDCYWLAYRFHRPVGTIKSIKQNTRQGLDQFLKTTPPTPHEIQLSVNISLTVLNANQKSFYRFRIMSWSDLDSGGWVKYLYPQNIHHCIQEKTAKIQPYWANYREWWLLLVDAIGISLDKIEISDVVKPSDWKKIIVIDPSTKAAKFEI